MTPAVVIGCALLGLMTGSFLNVVVHRVPMGQSVVTPGSHCPRCRTPVRGRDNVPVASWVALRGRCRDCCQPISARYPLVEVATAALFAALAVRLGASWALPAYLVCFASLLALSAIDLDHGVLPPRVVSPTLVVTGALLVGAAAAEGRWGDLGDAGAGAAAALAFLAVLCLVHPNGMGLAHAGMWALIGIHLGFLSGMHVFMGIVAATVFAAVTRFALRTAGKRAGRGPLPFTPFLALGALVTVLFSAAVQNCYDQAVLVL